MGNCSVLAIFFVLLVGDGGVRDLQSARTEACRVRRITATSPLGAPSTSDCNQSSFEWPAEGGALATATLATT